MDDSEDRRLRDDGGSSLFKTTPDVLVIAVAALVVGSATATVLVVFWSYLTIQMTAFLCAVSGFCLVASGLAFVDQLLSGWLVYSAKSSKQYISYPTAPPPVVIGCRVIHPDTATPGVIARIDRDNGPALTIDWIVREDAFGYVFRFGFHRDPLDIARILNHNDLSL